MGLGLKEQRLQVKNDEVIESIHPSQSLYIIPLPASYDPLADPGLHAAGK